MTALEIFGESLGIVDFILSVCKTIYNMVDNAKANKKRCRQIADRVRALEDLVLTIKRRGQSRISSSVHKALKELHRSLDAAEDLVTQFSQTTPFGGFMKSSRIKEKFLEVDKRLTDNLHVLSGALLIEQGNVLHKVYKTVQGKHCPPTRSTTPTSLQSFTSQASSSVPAAATPACFMVSPVQMYRPVTGFMHLPAAMMTPFTVTTTTISRNAQVLPDFIRSLIGQPSVRSMNSPVTFSTLTHLF